MVNFGQATYIDGTVVPGAELRRNTQRDTGSGSGVVRPGDLKITQMDTPGPGVKVAVGDALIQSRAPGSERETYGVPLVTAQIYMGDGGAGLPGTGSQVPPEGYRRDFIFLEMLDPGLPTSYTPKEDWPAGQSVKLSVIQNVGPAARKMADIPALASVTGEGLAAIKYLPSTATVTNAMIEDLREVQNPRTRTEVRSMNLTGADKKYINKTTPYPAGGQTWPAQAEDIGIDLKIPEWATVVKIESTIYQAWVPAKGSSFGEFWVQMAPSAHPDNRKTQPGRWDIDELSAQHRTTNGLSDTIRIPPSLRGTTQKFYPRANVLGGNGEGANANTLAADFATSFNLTCVFQEEAD